MSEPTHPNAELLRDEELVAYLDGELDDEAARRIEARLSNDETARSQMLRLERTWRMLDTLPRNDGDEALHKSTVEMLAVEVEAEVAEQATRRARRRVGQWLAAAGSLFAAGWLGVVGADRLWSDADAALLRDLPVIQDLDTYQQADNIEFLRLLHDHGLFVKDVETERLP